MLIKTDKIRFGLLTYTLLGIAAIATDAPLALHLDSCYCDHHAAEESDHHDPSDKPQSHHDHDTCLVCQLLLGPSGQFFCTDSGPIILTVEQILSTDQAPSIFIDQHDFSPAAPRGPPLS